MAEASNFHCSDSLEFRSQLELKENFWAKIFFRLKYSLSKVVFLTNYLNKLNQIQFYAIADFLYYSFKQMRQSSKNCLFLTLVGTWLSSRAFVSKKDKVFAKIQAKRAKFARIKYMICRYKLCQKNS
ncbi:hypothetical protein C7B80_16050 [Cyanosarcina cf. burmensis CCALA 770]|nr:hypothetical protein C7B80_16050 [Cyanosarcina cf. burmensis CCALA 770]